MDQIVRHVGGIAAVIAIRSLGLISFGNILSRLAIKLGVSILEGQIGQLYQDPRGYISSLTGTPGTNTLPLPLPHQIERPVDTGANTVAVSTDGGMAAGGGGDILGQNDTSIARRRKGTFTESFTRLYYHSFTEHAMEKNPLALSGTDGKVNEWSVLPFANAFPKCIMPRQWHALCQKASGLRIKNASVKCYGFSPYITTTQQTLTQVQTTPNSWFYCCVDDDYLLPGYNTNEAQYDCGFNGQSGNAELRQWKLGCEPQIGYRGFDVSSSSNKFVIDGMNVNIFNHPGLQLIKQTENFSYSWSNRNEEYFHPAMPYVVVFSPCDALCRNILSKTI